MLDCHCAGAAMAVGGSGIIGMMLSEFAGSVANCPGGALSPVAGPVVSNCTQQVLVLASGNSCCKYILYI